MAYSKLTNVKIPAYSGNYTKGRKTKIKKITLHHMAGVLTAEQCGNIWKKVGRKGSSHYGIGNDGRIGNYVDEKDTAWTDSNWNSNCKSVTIEVSNSQKGGDWPVSDAALNSLIRLVADIAKRNNLGKLVKGENLTWHCMYAATGCPGKYLLSKMNYIEEEANKLIGKDTSHTYSGTFPSLGSKGYLSRGDKGMQVKYLQRFLNWYGNYKLAIDSSFGPAVESAVKKYQKAEGLKVDGYFGSGSLAHAKKVKK